jgi:hypothetical protein
MPFLETALDSIKFGRSSRDKGKHKSSDAFLYSDVLLPKSEAIEESSFQGHRTGLVGKRSIEMIIHVALAFFAASTVLLFIGYVRGPTDQRCGRQLSIWCEYF